MQNSDITIDSKLSVHQPTSPPNRGSWFADLRAKLNQFSAIDFLSNFGFTSRNSNSGADLRKPSIRDDQVGLSSRSVMNLSTQMDDHQTLIRNEDSMRNSVGNNRIATSIRHSDEPRRRLLISKSETNENTEKLKNLKQSSEPPNFGSPNDRHSVHDDEERPISFSEQRDAAIDTSMDENVCEVQRFGTITGLVPTGKRDAGVGHSYEVAPTGYPTWCDKCGDFISGLYDGQAVRCRNCRFTCHVQCQPLVTLDCRSSTNSLKSEKSSVTEGPDSNFDTIASETSRKEKQISETDYASTVGTEVTELTDFEVEQLVQNSLEEINDELQQDLPRGDKLLRLIEEYNKEISDGLAMTLEDDGITFHGFLQIHMNFSRPINVVAGEQPDTIYDVLVSENDQDNVDYGTTVSDGRKTITSFYLPRNTVKVLHITSETTTSEMIVSLLKKFKVADNPRKFALYERDLEPGKTLQARLNRIPEEACPLRLALFRGCKKKTTRFVLQENETGDIMWEAFEIPELQNFLKILDIEESQYIKQIEQRYYVYRYWLEAEIRHRIATRTPTAGSRTSYNGIFSGQLDDESVVEV